MLSFSRSDVKEAQISAVIIRADGTREDVGVISYYHKNIFRRWLGNARIKWAALKRSFF